MQACKPAVSVIVPTYREAENIEPLVQRICAATTDAGLEVEVVIVDDDSDDGTDALVAKLGRTYPVRLIVRRGERGLSSAVLAGLAQAKHDVLVVLDADLQHPPEAIPELVAQVTAGGCDFAIGTRYAKRAAIAENWPWTRRFASRCATWLARPLAPLSDPMSGFFAMPRRTWTRADRLDPVGYKIALELYVKCGCRRAGEVPIRFGTRVGGVSKMSMGVNVDYLRHLARLYRYRFPWLCWLALAALLAIVAVLAL